MQDMTTWKVMPVCARHFSCPDPTSRCQVSGFRCQERQTQKLKPLFWILTPNSWLLTLCSMLYAPCPRPSDSEAEIRNPKSTIEKCLVLSSLVPSWKAVLCHLSSVVCLPAVRCLLPAFLWLLTSDLWPLVSNPMPYVHPVKFLPRGKL